MIDPPQPSEESREHAIKVHPSCLLGTQVLSRLQGFANARGVSITEALHQLLDAGTRHLKRESVPASLLLSKKQAAVYESLRAGHSVKEIAEKLRVSEGTVRTHINRMRSRLNHSDLLSLRFHRDGDPVINGPAHPSIHPTDASGL